MPTLYSSDQAVDVRSDDISAELLAAAYDSLAAAVDIETTGLDWRASTIASVQVAVPGGRVEIVRFSDEHEPPARLAELLEAGDVLKVFHHAMFDLRFMRAHWGLRCTNAACTKVAAKLADPAGEIGHGLKELVGHHLGVALDKSEQTSDWLAADLTSAQLDYAADDVRHLAPLLYSLLNALRSAGLEELALECFQHLPTRVELEVRGFDDVFVY